MLKLIQYKEWVKLRWITLGLIGIGIIINIYVLLDLRNSISLNGAAEIWYITLYWHVKFYLPLKILPIISGLILGLFQFIPEIINKRLKLSLHIPVGINTIISHFVTSGITLLTIIYLITFGSLLATSRLIFYSDVTLLLAKHIVPWLLSGYIIYFSTCSIVTEKHWVIKSIVFLIGFTFSFILLEKGFIGEKDDAIWLYLSLTIGSLIFPFYSIWRYKKGVNR